MIDAFNTDKPYNQFIIEQLAADRVLADAKGGAEPDDAEGAHVGAGVGLRQAPSEQSQGRRRRVHDEELVESGGDGLPILDQCVHVRGRGEAVEPEDRHGRV